MKGNPKYNIGDRVSFTLQGKVITGEICVVDRYGTFGDDSDVSYDVFSVEENCLYKHFNESFLTLAEE